MARKDEGKFVDGDAAARAPDRSSEQRDTLPAALTYKELELLARAHDPPDEKDRATIRTTLSFEQMMALEHGSEEDTVATDDAEDDATSVPESGVLRKKKPRK